MAKTNNKTGQQTMTFDEGLDDKNLILGKEITITNVSEEKEGNLGGKFSVADIEFDGVPMQIAFGSVLTKQFAEWKEKAGDNAIPAIAVIVKQRGKRYFSFTEIRSA